MIDVMLDLETIGTKPGSVILSIGACVFNLPFVESEFYCTINREDSVANGMTIDPSTLDWWQKQSPDARKVLDDTAGVGCGYPLAAGLTAFQRWLSTLAPLKEIALWGNGSDFDNVLLAQAYAAAKMDYPIRYYNNRCFRTLKNLGFAVNEPERKGTFHNALDDAKHQAKWAELILSELRRGQTAVRVDPVVVRKLVVIGDTLLDSPADATAYQPIAGSDGA